MTFSNGSLVKRLAYRLVYVLFLKEGEQGGLVWVKRMRINDGEKKFSLAQLQAAIKRDFLQRSAL